MTSNMWIALAIAISVMGSYAGIATHHYNRGYEAHKAEVAKEIEEVNDHRQQLAAMIAKERAEAADVRQKAVDDAIEHARGYCAENPAACGIAMPAPAPVPGAKSVPAPPTPAACTAMCTTPAAVTAKLNAIK